MASWRWDQPAPIFPDADPDEVDALLELNHLSPDKVRLNQNVFFVDTGDRLIQFDSGIGVDPSLGRGIFGPTTGLLLPNARLAGIEPEDIDIVALTHVHPDHAGGLVDADGIPLYPNARIAVSREDFDYWTDLSHLEFAPDDHIRGQYLSAVKNLTPYARQDRIIWMDDGASLVPGITAIATPGHSPGHRVYLIESEGCTIVCWGDLCHHEIILLQRPEWGFQFDHDQPAATAQRQRIYEMVEANRHQILAYHFPFPGLGNIKKAGTGYAFVPTDLARALPQEARGLITAHPFAN